MAEVEAEALRRRLYTPEATEADVARYAAAGGRRTVGAAAPSRRRRRMVAPITVCAAAGLVALGAVLVPRPSAAPRPRATATPSPAGLAIVVAATDRQRFVTALRRDADAGLGAFFARHHDALPGPLLTPSRADSTEYRGESASGLRLSPSALAMHGGRLTVTIVTDRDASVRLDAGVDGSGRLGDVPAASHLLRLTAGAPQSTTTRYAGTAPTRLDVLAPDGVRWGVLATFTD